VLFCSGKDNSTIPCCVKRFFQIAHVSTTSPYGREPYGRDAA
jgi:hypothetical protein